MAFGSVQLLQSLLNSGVPVDVKDSNEEGNTLLHWASSYSAPEAVKILCGEKDDVILLTL